LRSGASAMRTSFASLEPETPQYLHLFRKCADRWALCSGRLGTFDWLGVRNGIR
jgi:hypothetical protein